MITGWWWMDGYGCEREIEGGRRKGGEMRGAERRRGNALDCEGIFIKELR
jgi:hypothetical protein